MADVNANIDVNIDTSDALNQLKSLQRAIATFHQSIAKNSVSAVNAQRDLQKNLINSVNSIQGLSAEFRTIKSTSESFTESLEKNKFSIREYFRYAASQSKTFGRSFTAEFDTIEKTAIERVKTLQTQYIKMGRDAGGALKAIAIRPTTLDMDSLATRTAIAAQKSAIFNQLIKQGSTNLLNFGKNTQWAGRQLMVGFTLPLATLGMTASRVFMDMEKAAIKFKKVYGDLFTAPEETQQALDEITKLAEGYTKYGVAVSDVVNLASEAAAAGFAGVDLQSQTNAATKLSILGQLEYGKALETTISLQNAFNISADNLASSIDFLNAVENQTVVSLDDITTAVPKVAPVIQQLGGDVKDLAFFLAAMKEGGVNASEGANALKSGLAALINPTGKASEMLANMGINVEKIVEQNKGDLKSTVVEFAKALDTLDPLNRARAIEQLFGKFQFARLSTLFENVIRDGTQASRVLDLAGASVDELATLSEKELGVSAESAMNKFTGAIERLKIALVPIGELFLKIVTPFVEFGQGLLENFNKLPEGIKQAIGTVITIVGGLGPVLLMTFGLINNGIANMIKFFANVRLGYLKLTGQLGDTATGTQYLTMEQLQAEAAAASLNQAHSTLAQTFNVEAAAIDRLRLAYEQALVAAQNFAITNPGMMKPGFTPPSAPAQRYANGGFISGPGTGKSDSIAAMVSNGEAIIPADKAKKYAPLVQAIIAGKVPGFAGGTANFGGGNIDIARSDSAAALQAFYEKLIRLNRNNVEEVNKMFASLVTEAERTADGLVRLTKEAAEQVAKNNPNIKTTGSSNLQLGHLQTSSEVLPSGERISGSLVRAMTASQNKSLDQGGQYAEDFIREWNSVANGLADTVKLGGLKLTDEILAVTKNIDNDIRDIAVNMANGGKITDKILAEATDIALQRAKALGGVDAQVAQALEKTKTMKVVLPATVESLASSEALKTLRDKYKQVGIDFAKLTSNELKDILLQEGLIVPKQTRGGRTDYVTTEAGAALTSRGAGSRLFRTDSDNNAVAVERFSAEQGQPTYLGIREKTARLVSDIADEIGEQLDNASEARSPSKKIGRATENIVDGVDETIRNAKDDVANATEEMISPITGRSRQPRRASSSMPEPQSETNRRSRQNRRASAPQGAPTPSQETIERERLLALQREEQARQKEEEARQRLTQIEIDRQNKIQGVTQNALASFSNFANKMSGVTMALSSLTGILYMFGGEFQALNGIISGLSAAMFALIQTTAALARSQAFAKATNDFNALSGAAGTSFATNLTRSAKGAGEITKGFAGLANGAKNLFGIFKTAFPLMFRLIPIIGGLTIAWQVFQFVIDQVNREKAKLNGLSEAANMAAGKITALGNAAGASQILEKQSFRQKSKIGDLTGQQKAQTKSVIDAAGGMEEFKKEYADEILAIEQAKGESERLLALYRSLAIQFNALGMAPDAIEKIINALRQAAGEKDVTLDFKSLTILTEDDFNVQAITTRAQESVNAFNKIIEKNRIKKENNKITNPNDATDYEEGLREKARDISPELIDEKSEKDKLVLIKETVSATVGELEALGTAYKSGKINTKQYDAAIVASMSSLQKMGNAFENNSKILKKFGIPSEVRKSLTSTTDQMIVLDAVMKGIDLTDFNRALASGTPTERAIALQKLAAATKAATLEQDANNKAIASKKSLKGITDNIRNVRKQIRAYKDITAATGDRTLAWQIASDASLQAAYNEARLADQSAKLAGQTSNYVGEFLESVKKLNKLSKEFSSFDASGGGAGEKSKFQQAIDQLKEQRTEIKNNIVAYNSLRKAGFSVAKASELAEDSLLAAALASTKVGSKQWQELTKQIKLAQKASMATLEGRKEEFLKRKALAEELFDIQEKLVEQKYRDQIKKQEDEIESLTKAIKVLNKEVDKYQDQIEDIQRKVEIDFDRPIAVLQEESSDLANDLTLMDKAADEITKRYEEQAKALEDVAKANERILNQQKSQLGLANALSSGDIAQAASIMQDMRANNADAAKTSTADMLNVAKEKELAALVSATGKTREQIQNRQFEIGQLIYQLEEKKEIKLLEIRDLEDKIYTIKQNQIKPLENAIDLAQEILDKINEQKQVELDAIDTKRLAWEDTYLKIQQAEIRAGKFRQVIKDTEKFMAGIVDKWTSIKSKEVTLTVNTVNTSGGGGGGAAGNLSTSGGNKVTYDTNWKTGITEVKSRVSNAKSKLPDSFGTNLSTLLNKYILARDAAIKSGSSMSAATAQNAMDALDSSLRSYGFASGGKVSGPGTTTSDSILARVSNGEYILRAEAVKALGIDMLDKLNYADRFANGGVVGKKKNFTFKNFNLDKINENGLNGIMVASQKRPQELPANNSMYNYNLSINVEGSNSSANEIANVVISKIRAIDSQRVRGQAIR